MATSYRTWPGWKLNRTLSAADAALLIELLFRNPYVTVRNVQRATGLTNQGARNILRKAEDRGWVESIGTHGRGGREYWLASEIYRVIEAPMRAVERTAVSKSVSKTGPEDHETRGPSL